jgi:hypothetical protein
MNVKLLISITEIIDCTSATMKANVFRPPKNPTATQMRNMKPESTRMLARRPSNRMWLHPGVVGENDNYQHTHNKITQITKSDICHRLKGVTITANSNCIYWVKPNTVHIPRLIKTYQE